MNTIRLITFILTITTLTSGYVIKRSKNNDFTSVTKLSTEPPSVTDVSFTTVPTSTAAYYICVAYTTLFGTCNCKTESTTVPASTTHSSKDISTKSPTTTSITNKPQTTTVPASTTHGSKDVSTKSPTTTSITNKPQTTTVPGSTTDDSDESDESDGIDESDEWDDCEESDECHDFWDIYVWIALDK